MNEGGAFGRRVAEQQQHGAGPRPAIKKTIKRPPPPTLLAKPRRSTKEDCGVRNWKIT